MTLSADTAERLHARRDGVLLGSTSNGAQRQPAPAHPANPAHPAQPASAPTLTPAPAAAPAELPIATPLGTPISDPGAVPGAAPAAASAAAPAPAGAGEGSGGHAALQGIMQAGYQLGEEIGRGGLGQVNRAVQRVFGRNVAIKQLSDGAANDRAVRKFFAEALVAALLEHPNILPIHDLIVAADGRLQLVMKRVEGLPWGSLLTPYSEHERARAAMMTLEDHLDILMKVCDAVSFAHGRGILHCDLKPDNVMVGAFGEVLVMDWGCAMALVEGQHHPLIPCVQQLKTPNGTPSYMAPESVLANSANIGTHSDVYQLGAIIYELLTGQQPNRGNEVDEVMQHAAFGTIVPPAQLAADRDIPDELSDIALLCLHKDPALRIQSVGALIIRLTAYRRHAQAVTLAARSRAMLSAARAAGGQRDELLRQALSSAEQAYAIWPEWRGSGLSLVNAQLGHAQHHLDSGAATAALGGCQRAADLASTLRLTRQEAAARRLAEAATAARQGQEAAARALRRVRLGLAGTLAALIIGLIVSVIVVASAEGRLVGALHAAKAAQAQAEAALTALTDEQRSRSADQKRFVPALIVQARKAMQGGQWDAALHALETAIGFDAVQVEARALYANVLAAGGHYQRALDAITHWLELAPGDAQAGRLRALCARAHDGVAPDLELKSGLAALFSDERLYSLAESVAVAAQDRLEIYRKRIDALWPGVGVGLAMRADGLLITPLDARACFAGHTEIADISALEGMPFAVLNLAGTQIADLAPLHGMPLEALNLERTPVADLAPLAGMRLATLQLGQTRVASLAPLHGMALTRLTINDTRVDSLALLQGMAFARLDLSHTAVESLVPLAGVGQGELIARWTRVHALSPLIATPIAALDLTGCHLDDLAVLGRMAVQRFSGLSLRPGGLKRILSLPVTGIDLGECPELTDLEALRGMRLTALSVSGAPLSDLSPLSGMPLRTLTVRGCKVRSLEPLRGMRLEWLDAARTPVDDLAPLLGMPLRTLAIDHTQVHDLTPLGELPLEELRFGPLRGAHLSGLAGVRALATIRSIGTAADQLMPAQPFWAAFDKGEIP
jgi:Protein kinase domain